MGIRYKIHPSGSIEILNRYKYLLVLVEIYDKNNILLSKCILNVIACDGGFDLYKNYLIIKQPENKLLTNGSYCCGKDGYYNSYEDEDFYLVEGDNNTVETVYIELTKIKILDFWDPDDLERKRHKEYFRDNVWEEMMKVFWNPKRKWTMWYLKLE
jgi:hypothetical protein